MEKAKERLSKLKFESGSLEFRGCGTFPERGYAKIVWLGIIGEEMRRNAEAVMKEFSINENRETTLHLTVARVYGKSNKIKSFLERYEDKGFGSFTPEHICIYESVLKKPNPEYRIIERFSLLPA